MIRNLVRAVFIFLSIPTTKLSKFSSRRYFRELSITVLIFAMIISIIIRIFVGLFFCFQHRDRIISEPFVFVEKSPSLGERRWLCPPESNELFYALSLEYRGLSLSSGRRLD